MRGKRICGTQDIDCILSKVQSVRILQNKNPECRICLHNLWMFPNVPCKEAHEFTYLERATISVHRYFTSKALRRVVKASPLLLFVVIRLLIKGSPWADNGNSLSSLGRAPREQSSIGNVAPFHLPINS